MGSYFMYNQQQSKWYPKGVYLPISKLHSILAVANLLAHNNISQICYCGQISLQSTAVNCTFSDNLRPLEVTFISLAMIQHLLNSFILIFYKISLIYTVPITLPKGSVCHKKNTNYYEEIKT